MYRHAHGANAASVLVEAFLRIRRLIINTEVIKCKPARRCMRKSLRPYVLSAKHEAAFKASRLSERVYLFGDAASEDVVFYLHGGAYWHDPTVYHFKFLKELTDGTGCSAVLPIYPKSPAHTCDDMFDMLLPLCRDALSRYARVILIGDSAGAGLAQSLVQLLAAERHKLPEALVLLSPCADLTFDSPEVAALERKDAMLSIRAIKEKVAFFAGARALTDPKVSPLFGRYEAFPPTHIFTSTHDLLYGDALKISSKLKQQACESHLYVYPGMPHTFMLLPLMPQAKDARAKIARIVKDIIENE